MQATFTKQVISLVCHTMEEMGSPFEEETGDMLVLETRYIVGGQVASTVTSIYQIGKVQYNKFT